MSGQSIHYADYLQLNTLLSAQGPLSDVHEEMLFIITHQAYELWFKQMHHDVDSILAIFSQNSIEERSLLKVLSRVKRLQEIMKVMSGQFDILETMSPLEFLEFRHLLVPASGFQSVQYRSLEVKLGLKMKERTKEDQGFFTVHLREDERKILEEIEAKDGLLQEISKWLERFPFLEFSHFNFWDEFKKSVQKMLKGQENLYLNQSLTEEEKKRFLQFWKAEENHFESLFDENLYEEELKSGRRKLSQKAMLSALFINFYRDEPLLHLPYQLISSLIDLDELFSTWRYRHTMLAQRMLGMRPGTGGSLGHRYLANTTQKNRLFLDFYALATYLLPQKDRPALPKELKEMLGHSYKQGS